MEALRKAEKIPSFDVCSLYQEKSLFLGHEDVCPWADLKVITDFFCETFVSILRRLFCVSQLYSCAVACSVGVSIHMGTFV